MCLYHHNMKILNVIKLAEHTHTASKHDTLILYVPWCLYTVAPAEYELILLQY